MKSVLHLCIKNKNILSEMLNVFFKSSVGLWGYYLSKGVVSKIIRPCLVANGCIVMLSGEVEEGMQLKCNSAVFFCFVHQQQQHP